MFDHSGRPNSAEYTGQQRERSEYVTASALVTPPGRSAIATVLVHGPNALHTIAGLCHVDARQLARKTSHGQLWIGNWKGAGGEPIVVHFIQANLIEIHCHGGLVPSRTILADLAQVGIATIPWQELDRRSTQSIIESEALQALTQAPTLRTATILLDQFRGALTTSLNDLLRQSQQGMADAVSANLARLLEYSELGRHLVTPWRVAIVGRPNVGKSSLLNAILGFDRAIVHATAGTTRDLVTAMTAIDGWPVEFSDSAGIRISTDELESAGIDLSRGAIVQSDRQLVVCDASRPLTDDDKAILRSCPNPIVVANKTDLAHRCEPSDLSVRTCSTSARTGAGIGDLLSHLATSLVPQAPLTGAAVPFSTRQIELLKEAQRCVCQQNDLASASDCLTRCVGLLNKGVGSHK